MSLREEALRAILQSVRGDEKGEYWTIRAFLDKHGVFNGDIQSGKRLVEKACELALEAERGTPAVAQCGVHLYTPDEQGICTGCESREHWGHEERGTPAESQKTIREEDAPLLEWAERQLSNLVTDDDGNGAFIRGTSVELAGFGEGMKKLRSAIRARQET